MSYTCVLSERKLGKNMSTKSRFFALNYSQCKENFYQEKFYGIKFIVNSKCFAVKVRNKFLITPLALVKVFFCQVDANSLNHTVPLGKCAIGTNDFVWNTTAHFDTKTIVCVYSLGRMEEEKDKFISPTDVSVLHVCHTISIHSSSFCLF